MEAQTVRQSPPFAYFLVLRTEKVDKLMLPMARGAITKHDWCSYPVHPVNRCQYCCLRIGSIFLEKKMFNIDVQDGQDSILGHEREGLFVLLRRITGVLILCIL